MGQIAKQYAESIAATLPHTTCILIRIPSSPPQVRTEKLSGKLLHEQAGQIIIDLDSSAQPRETQNFVPIISDFPDEFTNQAVATIIAEGDAIGLVCILSNENKMNEQDLTIAKIGASFLGKQMED